MADLKEEGVFRLESDGSEPVYTDWHYNEPDNTRDADCSRLKKLVDQWKWADFPCSESSYNQFTIHAICESDLHDPAAEGEM